MMLQIAEDPEICGQLLEEFQSLWISWQKGEGATYRHVPEEAGDLLEELVVQIVKRQADTYGNLVDQAVSNPDSSSMAHANGRLHTNPVKVSSSELVLVLHLCYMLYPQQCYSL